MARRVIPVAGAQIELFEFGAGEPILFLHGASGFFPDDPYVEPLAERRCVLVPSHPGFGQSSLPDWLDNFNDVAHIYLELLDRIGLEKVDVVGCSIGGWIAAEMGTMAPERIKSMVLASPVGVKVGRPDRLDVPDIFAMSQEQVNRLFFHDPARAVADLSALADERLATVVRNRETLALLSWEPYMHNPKLKHRLQRLRAPALFLRGGSDGFVSDEYFKAYAGLLPNARVETIPEAGHAMPLEQPEAFASRVLSFVG